MPTTKAKLLFYEQDDGADPFSSGHWECGYNYYMLNTISYVILITHILRLILNG